MVDKYTKMLEDQVKQRDKWIKNIRRQLGWWFINKIGAVSPLEKAELEIEWLKKQVDEKERLRNRTATAVVLAQEIIAKHEAERKKTEDIVTRRKEAQEVARKVAEAAGVEQLGDRR